MTPHPARHPAILMIRIFLNSFLLALVILCAGPSPLHAQKVRTAEVQRGANTVLNLTNDLIECTVAIREDALISDNVTGQSEWTQTYGTQPAAIETDADFAAEVMWTDWQAPGKVNNAENPVTFTKKDFRVVRHAFRTTEGGGAEIELLLKGSDFPLLARLRYLLDGRSFYIRREFALADSSGGSHFLQFIWPRKGRISGSPIVIKGGGFGQPIAFRTGEGGAFFGMEYPAADNTLDTSCGGVCICCGQEIGAKIGKSWLAGAWVVEGMSPDDRTKLWFGKYVDDIRVAPLRPYTLYNSWYDLRSPEYPKVPEGNVMNEKNILHIIDLIRKNMIEKHGITLDAFVLDDGWDVYKSDWVLRSEQFPHGLKPIADTLSRTGTTLGMWFGPIGGYSFRNERLGWMKAHGYEVVGDQMCVAGSKYSALLEKRTADFVAHDGVGFFKWDGFQFSCSEPDHGHPVGIYSRRAVMETVIAMCRGVRRVNPNTYLNITSGTWLSPWWVQYANQIWMQGEDYGYADVPSISPRDAAITYRDLALYDDFRTNDFWFPIQNLMTHGIIKGNLEKLGGENEPLDKFTNEVLLYFARGVSMWELYISPDILTDGEWDAMARAMLWAKDRFPVLSTTEMIGGDPKKRETYGYVHFRGSRGIIAARNPWVAPGLLKVGLSTAYGLDREASSLVLERVYPTRWISPTLYKAGSEFDIPLDGYETAIYEVYPLAGTAWPLVAGATFDVMGGGPAEEVVTLHEVSPDARVLNPETIVDTKMSGSSVKIADVLATAGIRPARATAVPATMKTMEDRSAMNIDIVLDGSVSDVSLNILLTPDDERAEKTGPLVKAWMDGKETPVQAGRREGRSQWITISAPGGRHSAHVQLLPAKGGQAWSGHAAVWLLYHQQMPATQVTLVLKEKPKERPMPPRPWATGIAGRSMLVGETDIGTSGIAPVH